MTGAIIGCGRISFQHVEGLVAAGVRIAALVNRTEEKARALAEAHGLAGVSVYPSLKAMLAEFTPDLATIALADSQHDDAVASLLDRGVAVYCEKPLAPTAERALRLAELADRTGVPAAMRFPVRFMPVYRAARRLIESGAVGTPHAVSGRLSVGRLANPEATFEWRMDAGSAPLGVLGDLGSHFFDLTHYLLDIPEDIRPEGCALSQVVIHGRPAPTDAEPSRRLPVATADLSTVAASYPVPNNPLGLSFYFSRVSPGTHLFQVDGSEGSLRVGEGRLFRYRRIVTEHQRPVSQFEEVGEAEIATILASSTEPEPGAHPEFAAFVEALRDGRQPQPGFAQGYRVLRDLESLR